MYDMLLPKFVHTLELGAHDGWHSGLPRTADDLQQEVPASFKLELDDLAQ